MKTETNLNKYIFLIDGERCLSATRFHETDGRFRYGLEAVNGSQRFGIPLQDGWQEKFSNDPVASTFEDADGCIWKQFSVHRIEGNSFESLKNKERLSHHLYLELTFFLKESDNPQIFQKKLEKLENLK